MKKILMIVIMAVMAPALVAQENDGARPIGDLGWKLWAKVRDMAQSEWSIFLPKESPTTTHLNKNSIKAQL